MPLKGSTKKTTEATKAQAVNENPWANGAKPSNPKDAVSYKKVPFVSVVPTTAIVGIAMGMIDGRAESYNSLPLASVVPVSAIVGMALGMEEGALKYSRHNYRIVGVRCSVYVDAADRHLRAWWNGQDFDPDSKVGLHHLEKVLASLAVLRDSIARGNWVDDRPPAAGFDWINEANAAIKTAGGGLFAHPMVTASTLYDEADRQLKAFWEGSNIDPSSQMGLHRLDKALAAIATLLDAIKLGTWRDNRPQARHDAWIDDANKKAEQLVGLYPNPPPPCTQTMIDDAVAAGHDVTIPTGRKE